MIKFLSLVILLTSCAKLKMAKIQSQEVKRIASPKESNRPHFYAIDFKLLNNKREIASVEDFQSELTNKQIYFLTLLQQYQTIDLIIGKEVNEFSCPKFHNDLLNYKSLIKFSKNDYSLEHNFNDVLNNEKLLASYPVMALPYQENIDIYSFYKLTQQNISKMVPRAIEKFNNKNLQELKEMCEVGSSDGYYIYENFVSIHSMSTAEQSFELKLAAVLNIPVFSNMLLIESLKKNQYESINIFNDKIIRRSNLGWFKNYLYELYKIRNNESKLSTNRSSIDEKLTHSTNHSVNF